MFGQWFTKVVLCGVYQIYIGSITAPEIKEKIENAKLILSVGSLKSDFNTGNFSYSIPVSNTVEVFIPITIPHR